MIEEGASVSEGARVWHSAYVGARARVMDGASVGALAHVDRDSVVGPGSRIGALAYLAPLTRIGRGVFVGPGAVFANDPYPPSGRLAGAHADDGSVIGANATVGAGVRIGERAVVAMGAVVTRDVGAEEVVSGSPARRVMSRAQYDRKREDWAAGSGTVKTDRSARPADQGP